MKLIDTGGASRSEPPYLTPEQVRGRPADPRGDVFRLGLLLYELLAGRPLFLDGSHPRAIHHIGAFDERELEPLPGCPPSLWTVLLQAIAAEPEIRFPSARVFADTLRGFPEIPVAPRQSRYEEDLQARLLDEALGLIGGSAEVAPLLVRLTRGCVARLGGEADEVMEAVLAARTLVLAARMEEPRRFVLPTLGAVFLQRDSIPSLGSRRK